MKVPREVPSSSQPGAPQKQKSALDLPRPFLNTRLNCGACPFICLPKSFQLLIHPLLASPAPCCGKSTPWSLFGQVPIHPQHQEAFPDLLGCQTALVSVPNTPAQAFLSKRCH